MADPLPIPSHRPPQTGLLLGGGMPARTRRRCVRLLLSNDLEGAVLQSGRPHRHQPSLCDRLPVRLLVSCILQGPDKEWIRPSISKRALGAKESLEVIRRAVKENGPYDGLLGAGCESTKRPGNPAAATI